MKIRRAASVAADQKTPRGSRGLGFDDQLRRDTRAARPLEILRPRKRLHDLRRSAGDRRFEVNQINGLQLAE